MSDTTTEETVEALRTKVRELEELLIQLGRETVDAVVDAARARIDTLRVRADLGRMDARDEVSAELADVDQLLRTAEQRAEGLTAESSDVGAALVEGVRSARSDIAAAVELARERLAAGRTG